MSAIKNDEVIDSGAKSKTSVHGGEKYLTFFIGEESYAVPVLKVREIIRMQPIHAIPEMPDYIRGIINLRGKIIPVVDMRVKFGIPSPTDSERTGIIVVQGVFENQSIRQIGIVVDGVDEVVQITPQDREDAPDFGVKLETQYINGIAKIKGKVVIMLEMDRVLSSEIIANIQTKNQI